VTQRDLKVRRGGCGRPHGHGEGANNGRTLAALSSCGGGDCRSRLATRSPRPDPDDDQVAGLSGGDQAEDGGADDGGHVGLLQIKTGLIFYKNVFKFFCFVFKKVRANANKGSCNLSSR
jgi:hypothetical protein